MNRKLFRNTLAMTCATLLGTAANAGLVAYFPVSSATDSRTFLDDVIDDPTHGTANGTTATGSVAHTYIVNNVTRGGDVLSTIEGHRFTAGTQDINLVLGFTWSLWVNIASSNIADVGGDVIIGTRQGSSTVNSTTAWHKMDLTAVSAWNGGGTDVAYPTLADNTWHHIAYMGDTTNRQIWIDGVLVDTDTTIVVNTIARAMEIGGSSQFSEDVTGLYDEISIWNERLTGDESIALYELTSRSLDEGLLYTTAEFNQLKGVHDAATGSVVIGALTWNYATGLTGPAGVSLSGSTYTVVLDATAGTGLTAIPEPGSLALLTLGGLFIGVRRRGR